MNTDERGLCMEKKGILLEDQTYRIIGVAMEVLNTLGHGLHEKPYENAMVVEFSLKKNSVRAATTVSGHLQISKNTRIRA
jgi:GxxExxY protein